VLAVPLQSGGEAESVLQLVGVVSSTSKQASLGWLGLSENEYSLSLSLITFWISVCVCVCVYVCVAMYVCVMVGVCDGGCEGVWEGVCVRVPGELPQLPSLYKQTVHFSAAIAVYSQFI